MIPNNIKQLNNIWATTKILEYLNLPFDLQNIQRRNKTTTQVFAQVWERAAALIKSKVARQKSVPNDNIIQQVRALQN